MQHPPLSSDDHAVPDPTPQDTSEAPAPPDTQSAKQPRWPRRLRLCLEVALGVVAGLVILGGIVIWRISSEPVRLDFLTPYLEQALNLEDRGVAVEVGETLLIWEGWPRNVDLRARKIRISDLEGAELAELPDVSLTLSLRALMGGTFAATRFEVLGPEISVELDFLGEPGCHSVRDPLGAPANNSAHDSDAR